MKDYSFKTERDDTDMPNMLFDDKEQASAALDLFVEEVRALRKKYRLLNVAVVCDAAVSAPTCAKVIRTGVALGSDGDAHGMHIWAAGRIFAACNSALESGAVTEVEIAEAPQCP